MSEKLKIKLGDKEVELESKKEGKVTLLELPVRIEVAKNSFLHIGAAPSPLTEKKGAVFKVDRTPVIPASSFKGALRYQLELLFIENADSFAKLFSIPNGSKDVLKPCIPSPSPSKAEKELLNAGKYRGEIKGKYIGHCEIKAEEDKIIIPKIGDSELGICPVCYFMGATGIMGFLRISNFDPEGEASVIDQTNIRIDRKMERQQQEQKLTVNK